MNRSFRKAAVLLFVLILAAAPMFADGLSLTSGTGTTTGGSGNAAIDVTPLVRILALCTGIIPGVVIAIKFISEAVIGYWKHTIDPQGVLKAVVWLVIIVLILVCYSAFINYVFPAGGSTGTSSNELNTSSQFLKGLSGDTIGVSAGIIASGSAALLALI